MRLQTGHKGHWRELVSPEEVDEVLDYWPQACEQCRQSFCGLRVEMDEPTRHQVTELPTVRGHVVEHRLHWQWCDECQHATRADLPAAISQGAFGSKLIATVAYLSGQLRLSKRAIVSVLNDLFGVEISLGSISESEQTVSQAIANPVGEARDFVQGQDFVHADETSWRETNRRTWLWLGATQNVAVFLVGLKRNKDSAKQLLGGFSGVLVSDRLRIYDSYDLGRRQICWAHLRRDFQAMSERKGLAGQIGNQLVDETRKLFTQWHRVRDGTISLLQFQFNMAAVRYRIESLLADGASSGSSIAKSCRRILAYRPALWTFVDHADVEPTNNHAERLLRTAVIWRKLSFGTQSDRGSRFVERILSATATLRLQGRNVLAWLADAVQAATRSLPHPSLLPAS